jgi:hypothetical protein
MPSRLLLLIALLWLSSFVVHAQVLQTDIDVPARFQVYGGYSYLSNSLNGVAGSHHALNGFDAGMGFPAWHGLRFKLDVASYNGNNLGAPQHPYFVMGGAQYNWRLGRETLFAEGLGGDAGANKTWGANHAQGQTASFCSLLGGGVDTRITHAVTFRVEGGYQYSYFALIKNYVPYRIPGLPVNFLRASGGLVWEF